MDLYLIRHGETAWNQLGKIQGHIDVPLNEMGLQQAHAIARRMQEIPLDCIYSSDLLRASQTANTIGTISSIPVVLDARLRERNYGDFERSTWAEIHLQYPGIKQAWLKNPHSSQPPNGESFNDLMQRVKGFYFECIEPDRGSKKNIAVVSHNSPLKIILTLAQQRPIDQWMSVKHINNTEIFHLRFSGPNMTQILFGGQCGTKIAFHEEII